MDQTDQLQLEIQLRQARKADIEKRILDHKNEVEQVKSGIQSRAMPGQGAGNVPLDFLAIGDSWFEYPVNDDGLPFLNQAIPPQLEKIGNPPPKILNLARHGQASTAVLSWENQQKILDVLTDPSQTSWTNGKTADGILVSAGGDDIVGDQFAIYLDYHGCGLDQARFDGILASVQASYMDLFALRDVAAKKIGIDPREIPIFGHCYDYGIPDGKGIMVGNITISGPWIKPPLDFSGYDYSKGLEIITRAINTFHQMLHGLAHDRVTLPGRHTNNFHLVDTRNTITRDEVRPTGWANEIHPFTEGFAALAHKFLARLQKSFPDRI